MSIRSTLLLDITQRTVVIPPDVSEQLFYNIFKGKEVQEI
jgi:hypothetical protein